LLKYGKYFVREIITSVYKVVQTLTTCDLTVLIPLFFLMRKRCFFADDTDVLYNKFNVNVSSPPDNPPRHPNSNYSCAVATADHWRVVHCDERHHVVCQSDHDTLPGMRLFISSDSLISLTSCWSACCTHYQQIKKQYSLAALIASG